MGTLINTGQSMLVRIQSNFSHMCYLSISRLYSTSSHNSHNSHNKKRSAEGFDWLRDHFYSLNFVGDQNAMTVMTVMTALDYQRLKTKLYMTENPD